jgi:5-methylcytosine-specific restriction protein B
MRFRNQGTLFALNIDESVHLLSLMTESNPELQEQLESSENIGPLTRVTFHPSYSYEDFIEGFRPVDKGTGTLTLQNGYEDFLYARSCQGLRYSCEGNHDLYSGFD